MLMYGKNQHNIVVILQLKINKLRKNCYSSEYINDEKAKQPYCWYGRSFTSLVRKSNQPQHSLKPKSNTEQDPNSLQFCQDWEVRKLQKKNLKLAEVESVQFSSFQLLSGIRLFATPWTGIRQASLSITNSRSLLKFMSIESVMPSSHLILCRPLLLLSSIFPSIRVFSSESTLHIRWPKYWSFSFNISPSNDYSGLISFKMAWLDLLAV